MAVHLGWAMPLATGKQLGPYEIEAAIGAGGMGEVYRARDTRLGRTVAIKVLPEGEYAGEEARRRFQREATFSARSTAPHHRRQTLPGQRACRPSCRFPVRHRQLETRTC